MRSLQELFRRWPELSGFTIDQRDDGLYVVDVALNPGGGDVDMLRQEIAAVLSEAVEEDANALDVLGGRTFARTLH
jgi:hypothetical protein